MLDWENQGDILKKTMLSGKRSRFLVWRLTVTEEATTASTFYELIIALTSWFFWTERSKNQRFLPIIIKEKQDRKIRGNEDERMELRDVAMGLQCV